MSTAISDRSLEARLAALEMKFGLYYSSSTSSSITNTNKDDPSPEEHQQVQKDVESRLASIQSTMDKHTTPQFRTLWNESLTLLEELDPGTGLTHQQQPLLYKRQQVLAASESLQYDFEQLSKILNLLSVQQLPSTPPRGGGGGGNMASNSTAPISQDTVTQAPIITNISISPEQQRRLDAIRVTLQQLNGKTKTLTTKLQQLLETYHIVVAAASEKCILADEMIHEKEMSK